MRRVPTAAYAAQNLVLSAVEKIVLSEKEERKLRRGFDDRRTQTEVVSDTAQAIFPAFLENSGLNEKGEERNQIIDQLKATNDKELGKGLAQRCQPASDPAGHHP